MKKRWILKEPDRQKVNAISEEHNLSPLISQILLNRNLNTSEDIHRFLAPSLDHLPDPFLLSGMDVAVKRLVTAIRKKEPITVYGDYDVDGTTSTVLLLDFFTALGAKIDYYIPHRLSEGYSLNRPALEKIASKGTRVLITVDNGISAVEEVAYAKELGLDLIITDHHEVPENIPDAFAILNPKKENDPFPGKQLSGVGVAFYLLIALRKGLRDAGLLPDPEPNLRLALDLVALGTVADLVPLTGINRILVREGLRVLSRTPRIGLRALLRVSEIGGEVRADQIAFRLGPRINAAGRLKEASLGVKLLRSEDPKEARDLAEVLNRANESRKSLEDQITGEAIAIIEDNRISENYKSLVISKGDWHSGVIGIVASRLVGKFYLPAIVLAGDQDGLRGSARSIHGLNLVEALGECADLLEKFGGHAHAAGLSLKAENLEPFQKRFDEIVRKRLREEDFSPALHLDAESDLEWVDPNLLGQLKRLEPFGMGNPAPLFLLKGTRVRESRVVGEKHLKLKLGEGGRVFGAIGFRMAEKRPQVDENVDVAFFPEWNEWNGNKNIQLHLYDLKGSDL